MYLQLPGKVGWFTGQKGGVMELVDRVTVVRMYRRAEGIADDDGDVCVLICITCTTRIRQYMWIKSDNTCG